MGAVFRPYSPSDSLQSNRSAGDRQRHREKIRKAIRDNIADIVAEQSIIGRDGDTIIKVPIRGIKEYRFVYGSNTPGVGQGDGESGVGDVIAKGKQKVGGIPQQGGNEPGADIYETDITIEEIIDLMFEDLELPDMERKTLRQTLAQRMTKRKGYKRVGIRAHLDKKRTVKSRIKRRLAHDFAQSRSTDQDDDLLDQDEDLPGDFNDESNLGLRNREHRFPYHNDDLYYRRKQPDIAYESNAVVICLMDTSGSMDNMKKYLARSFFFLLYQFVRSRYENVDLVFVAHDTKAQEVDEDDFFHKGQAGGTMISSGYEKLIEIISERYDPSLWNVYAFHCSDGDNFPHDNDKAIGLAKTLCELCNLFGFGEIKPGGARSWEDSFMEKLDDLKFDNFETLRIEAKEDIWASFKRFLSKERHKDGELAVEGA